MWTNVQIIRLLLMFSVCIKIRVCNAAEKEVGYSCNAYPTDANIINMTIRIIPHQDPIYKVYGFDASSGDTSLSANRIDACMKDTTGLTDLDTQPITFDLTFDITGSTFDCGAALTSVTGSTGVVIATVVLRVFAYSETMLSKDDDVYVFNCRSDDLTNTFVSSTAIDQSTAVTPSITVLQAKYGSFLRIRDAETDVPVTVATLSQEVYMSVEFRPELRQGPDTYGTTFYVGFLGNDVISGTSASSLFIVVIPKNKGRTDVMVTTTSGTQQQNVSDASPMIFSVPQDLMGCSEGGVAELDSKGVKIHSYDSEVGVVVYNRESDSEDQYTALPLDVLGTKYYTVSPPALNDVSELMIIGTEEDTSVTITIPTTTTLSITLNGTTKSAGEALTLTLDELQTFHLAVSSSTVDESVTGFLITSDKPVSVISGSRKYINDHCVEQISPTTQLGDHYVLPPADPLGDGRLTTFVIQAVETGDTIVTRYLSSSTHENYTITLATNPIKTITVAHDRPCEIRSTKPVMVTQIVSPPPTGESDFETSMLVIPPVYRWSNEYILYQKDYPIKLVFVKPSSETEVQASGVPLSLPSATNVLGPGGFVFEEVFSLPADMKFPLTSSTAAKKVFTFMPIVYPQKTGTNNVGLSYIPPGLRHSDKDFCVPSGLGRASDGLDNDCDGLIDEELIDGLDNDLDGRIDEDTIAVVSENLGAVANRPVNCKVSALADFSIPAKVVSLTGSDGCFISRTGPFALSGNFENIVTDNIGGATQPKQLKSGNFSLAMFVDTPKLFFRCDASLCYSVSDTNCKTICNSARRRRQTNENADNKSTITSDVWIYPYFPGGNSGATDGNINSCDAGKVISAQTCLENTNIRVILFVLLALLLLAMSTAVCFCCLFRRRRDSEKRDNKHALYSGRSATNYSSKQFPTRYRF